LTSAAAIWRFLSPVPVADIWWIFRDFRSFGDAAPPLAWYWSQLINMPHRIPIARLVATLDWNLASGTQYLLVTCAIAAQAFHGWLVIRTFREAGDRTWPLTSAAFVFALAAPQQWENFLHGFQIVFTCWLCFGFLALRSITRDRPLKAHAAAIASMCSVVGGLLLWPVMLVVSWLRRQPAAVLAAGVLVPAIFAPVFFHGIVSTTPKANTHQILIFFVQFFAHPFLPAGSQWETLLGAVILAAGLSVLAMFARKWRDLRPLELLVAANLVYLILSIASISYGRAALGFAVRYNSVSLLFWAWLCAGLLMWNLRGGYVVLMVSMLVATNRFPDAWEAIRQEDRHWALELSRPASGASRTEALEELDAGMHTWLASQHKSAWAAAPFRNIGSRLETKAGPFCAGLVPILVTPLKIGFQIDGGGGPPREDYFYLVRERDSTVLGAAVNRGGEPLIRWIGFLPPSMAGETVRAATLDGCLGSQAIIIPAVKPPAVPSDAVQ